MTIEPDINLFVHFVRSSIMLAEIVKTLRPFHKVDLKPWPTTILVNTACSGEMKVPLRPWSTYRIPAEILLQ